MFIYNLRQDDFCSHFRMKLVFVRSLLAMRNKNSHLVGFFGGVVGRVGVAGSLKNKAKFGIIQKISYLLTLCHFNTFTRLHLFNEVDKLSFFFDNHFGLNSHIRPNRHFKTHLFGGRSVFQHLLVFEAFLLILNRQISVWNNGYNLPRLHIGDAYRSAPFWTPRMLFPILRLLTLLRHPDSSSENACRYGM